MDEVKNLNNYSILLLSAGMGRRLGNTGKKHPKCLLTINGKTLIERIINNLQKRNAKSISIIVGYKSKMLIDFITKLKLKNLKIKFIKIKGYEKYGHSYSWFKYKNHWLKEKKPLILLHTDIFFDFRYLDNMLKSKKTNIIGVKSAKNHIFKKESLVAKVNKKNQIEKINYLRKIFKPFGELIGINKFSAKTAGNIFNFMNKFFDKKTKLLSWENLMNVYVKKNIDQIFVLQNQNFPWININTIKDYSKAKKLKI